MHLVDLYVYFEFQCVLFWTDPPVMTKNMINKIIEVIIKVLYINFAALLLHWSKQSKGCVTREDVAAGQPPT